MTNAGGTDVKKISGIYCIENILNKKRYIGQASNLENRFQTHESLLKKGKHFNTHLQSSFLKYGKDYFLFRVLIYCEISELTYYEQFFVNYYKKENLYNLRLECVDSNIGIIYPKERNEKISMSKKGINHHFFGKHLSEETKIKISNSRTGRILSIETREKMSNSRLGIHISESTKKKLSDLNKGKNHPQYGKHRSEETKKKISQSKNGKISSSKGKPHSLDYNKKISESLKIYWKNKKDLTRGV